MIATLTRSTLSVAASAVKRIQDAYAEAYEYDTGFDAGEFSGPANHRASERAITEALAALGWTRVEYNESLVVQTSARYAHFSGLEVEDEHRDLFGRF